MCSWSTWSIFAKELLSLKRFHKTLYFIATLPYFTYEKKKERDVHGINRHVIFEFKIDSKQMQFM